MSDRLDDSTGYEVGFGKPPKETRFQKGNRANPNGRPKRDSSLLASYEKLLAEDFATRDGRVISNREAMMRAVFRDAMRGDQKAFARFLKLARPAGLLKIPVKEPPPKNTMTPEQKKAWWTGLARDNVPGARRRLRNDYGIEISD